MWKQVASSLLAVLAPGKEGKKTSQRAAGLLPKVHLEGNSQLHPTAPWLLLGASIDCFRNTPTLFSFTGPDHRHTAALPASSWTGQTDMNEHLDQHSGHTGDLSPRLEQTLGPVSSDCSFIPSKSSGTALSAKLRRRRAKVVSTLKSLTNSCKSLPDRRASTFVFDHVVVASLGATRRRGAGQPNPRSREGQVGLCPRHTQDVKRHLPPSSGANRRPQDIAKNPAAPEGDLPGRDGKVPIGLGVQSKQNHRL